MAVLASQTCLQRRMGFETVGLAGNCSVCTGTEEKSVDGSKRKTRMERKKTTH